MNREAKEPQDKKHRYRVYLCARFGKWRAYPEIAMWYDIDDPKFTEDESFVRWLGPEFEVDLEEETNVEKMNDPNSLYDVNTIIDLDKKERPLPIHPDCVNRMEERKFARKRKYFEQLIGTDFGAACLTEVNGGERLWQYAEKAEAQERFELSLATEKLECALNQWFGDKYTDDPRKKYVPDSDWGEGQLFLWEKSQYEKMMGRRAIK